MTNADRVGACSIEIIVLALTFLTLETVKRSNMRGIYGALRSFTRVFANSGGPVISMYFLAPIAIVSATVGKLLANRINQAVFNAIVIVLTIVSAACLLV